MKKILIFAQIIFLFLITACNNDLKYDVWKDTLEAFGDGTYQIIHQTREGQSVEILSNCKYNQCVMTNVKDYYVHENNQVYLIGDYYKRKVYCKLNIANNMLYYFAEENSDEFVMVYLNNMIEDKQIALYEEFDEFSKEDIIVFDGLE